jgi:hypothetical protein
MSGNLPGSYFSQQNMDAYRAREKFFGRGVATTPKERRAEIRNLAEEAYPGVKPQEWFAGISAKEKAEREALESAAGDWGSLPGL